MQVARRLDRMPEKGPQRHLGLRPADELLVLSGRPDGAPLPGRFPGLAEAVGDGTGTGGGRGNSIQVGCFPLSVYKFLKLKTEKSRIRNNSVGGSHRNDRTEKSYCIREKCPRKLSGMQQRGMKSMGTDSNRVWKKSQEWKFQQRSREDRRSKERSWVPGWFGGGHAALGLGVMGLSPTLRDSKQINSEMKSKQVRS